jgi:hypothetical protein
MRRGAASLWVGERQGTVEGYLWGKGSRLREYGGPSEVVLPMLHQLLERWDDPDASTSRRIESGGVAGRSLALEASLDAPELPDPVTRALDERGILCSRDYLGMIRLHDPASLLAAYPESGIVARDEGQTVEFADRSGRIRLARADAVKLLFGPERPADFARDRLPLRFHEWSADMV